MSSPSSSLNKYDLITLKNPYFLSEIKDIAQSNSFFSPVFENLHSPFIFKQKEVSNLQPSPLESTLFTFSKEILKVCFAFFAIEARSEKSPPFFKVLLFSRSFFFQFFVFRSACLSHADGWQIS